MIDSVSLWLQVEQILDKENHERLCNCVPWNEGGVCVTYGEFKPCSLSAHRAVEVALSLINTSEIEAQALEQAAEAFHWADIETKRGSEDWLRARAVDIREGRQ